MKDYTSENTVPASNQWSDGGNVLTVRRNGQKRVLFFGNSITRHEPKPDIGWSGDWGMAASAKEKDYVHLVLAGLEQRYGTVDWCIASGSEWERAFWQEHMPAEAYAAARDFDADIVIIRVGENILREDYNAHDFRSAAERIVRYLAPSTDAKVVVTDPFWFNAAMSEDFRVIAERNGYRFCPIGDLSRDESNMAIGKFEHRGVSIHPGDLGMARIAGRILTALDGANPKSCPDLQGEDK